MFAHETIRMLAIAVLILLSGCRPGPREILIGQDACAHCRMTVADERFAAELVTRTGKAYVFDSVECMAAFVAGDEVAPEDVHSRWFSDYRHPHALIASGDARILHAPSVQSPMGFNLAAFGPSATDATITDSHGGRILAWDEVVALVEGGVSGARPASHSHRSHERAP